MFRRQQKYRAGFTVVELVITIVIIGILAMLVSVGFGSWRTRAAETEVGSGIQGVHTSMESIRNMTNGYPIFPAGTEIDGTNDTRKVFVPSDTVQITYVWGNTEVYCINIQSTTVPDVSMFLDTTDGNDTAQEGTCSGTGPGGGGGTVASCTDYDVGDTGPGGGTVFYKGSGTCYEVAPTGWYDGSSTDPSAEWGCYQTAISGANGTAIGTGKQNTADILAAGCSLHYPDAGYPLAVDIATGYDGGGLNDWYMASRDEFQEVYNHFGSSGFMTCCAYWSSEQRNANDAWTQIFGFGGMQSNGGKHNRNRVRPIRSFSD